MTFNILKTLFKHYINIILKCNNGNGSNCRLSVLQMLKKRHFKQDKLNAFQPPETILSDHYKLSSHVKLKSLWCKISSLLLSSLLKSFSMNTIWPKSSHVWFSRFTVVRLEDAVPPHPPPQSARGMSHPRLPPPLTPPASTSSLTAFWHGAFWHQPIQVPNIDTSGPRKGMNSNTFWKQQHTITLTCLTHLNTTPTFNQLKGTKIRFSTTLWTFKYFKTPENSSPKLRLSTNL